MKRVSFVCLLSLCCGIANAQNISSLGSPKTPVRTRGVHIVDTAILIGNGDSLGAPIAQRLQSVFTTSYSQGPTLSAMFRANQTGPTMHSIQAVEGYTKTSHGSGTVNLSIGTIGNIEHAGAGTLLTARSIQAGGILSGTGVIVDAIPLSIMPIAITGTGTITNSYGLVVGKHVAGRGSIVNRFNIRTLDSTGRNHLRGSVEMPDLGQNVLDTAHYKLLVADDSGRLRKMYWPSTGQTTSSDGRIKVSTTQTGSAYTVEADKSVVFVNYDAGTAIISLPAGTLDREIIIKNLHRSNKVSIAGISPEDSNIISARGAVTVKFDGMEWVGIGRY